MQINGFGNLENKSLELDDNTNILYGKNETGKSTLAGFIKGIFYGVNRNKAGNETLNLKDISLGEILILVEN